MIRLNVWNALQHKTELELYVTSSSYLVQTSYNIESVELFLSHSAYEVVLCKNTNIYSAARVILMRIAICCDALSSFGVSVFRGSVVVGWPAPLGKACAPPSALRLPALPLLL